MLVYVDELLISSNNSVVITAFKAYLCKCFHMKDPGALKYFLGMEVAQRSSGVFVLKEVCS